MIADLNGKMLGKNLAFNQNTIILQCLVLVASSWLFGCTPATTDSPTAGSDNSFVSASAAPTRIVARGQIMPAQGILRLYSAPGDVVTQLLVSAGSNVKKDDVLAEMRSAASQDAQRQVLKTQKLNAQREHLSTVKQAELKLAAAEMKLEQIATQKQSWQRQVELLADGQRQLDSSEKILQRLVRISSDDLTREFVGQLDIDRQRLLVDEASSRLSQQRSASEQADADIRLAERMARSEVEAARALLEMAAHADPAAAFQSQLDALEVEQGRSILKAPIDGVVLSVRAAVGGAVLQTPLIEMADINSIVCELEVNTALARWIEVGQKVKLVSSSLAEPLTGVVQEKSRVVGQPKLKSIDPLAAVDYRTVSVIVKLDDAENANPWLQLQVEAEIDVAGGSAKQ